ncbi:hypothetical protein DERP_002634 [Dermatophagoides pteronyssinus]|uniref:Uncharacterized protein n=1 Tax=Dermatophagoides pteronyssinus TaxID=6956 RepID=A0ABQ8JVV3_DERPT|nr:hypothetical protein DERP_002634 [Dermatophagoides pteronyssinus]
MILIKNEVNSVLSIKNFASPYGITCRSAFDKLGDQSDIFHDLAEGVNSTIIAKGQIRLEIGLNLLKFGSKRLAKIELAVRLVEIFPEMMENPSDYAIYFFIIESNIFCFRHLPNICELRSSVTGYSFVPRENGLATPKVHFISHYPELTEFYGPLSWFAFIKYERVHSYLRKTY